MSPAINEELLVLAMCAYGGLVLMVCYDAIRIFRRVFRASIIRVIVEDVIFWTVAALFIFQIFFKYNYGRPRYYGVIAVLGTMALFEWLVGKRVVEKCGFKYIEWHKLRSTYGTALYKETGDIYLVADVLGHKDVNTTKKHYAAIDEDRRRSAANVVKLREP